jgi:hypothetical protein
VWPVWIAPLVAGIYYLALKGAFVQSIGGVVFDASDVNPNDIDAVQWGSHWIYRAFAETVSVAFGTFVAAGIARQRAKAAAIVGAFTISGFYLLRTAIWVYMLYWGREGQMIEPWPQHIVDACLITGTPFIGSAVSGLALRLNGPGTSGFAGINRLHFLWLWVAGALYAAGLVVPLTAWLSSQVVDYFEESRLHAIIHTIVLLVPVGSLALPGFWGLIVLSGQTPLSRAAENIVGPVILVIGWIAGSCVQFYWAKLIAWAFG